MTDPLISYEPLQREKNADCIFLITLLDMTETKELSSNTIVWLTKKRRDWLGARYVDATWDMLELERKQGMIVANDLLKVRMRVSAD